MFTLHTARSPRVFLVLRPQDTLPPFVTHLALTDIEAADNRLLLGAKEDVLATTEAKALFAAGEAERAALEQKRTARRERAAESERRLEAVGQARRALIELAGVNVAYGRPSEGQKERMVLKDVSWTVKEGERWVLAGHNGTFPSFPRSDP